MTRAAQHQGEGTLYNLSEVVSYFMQPCVDESRQTDAPEPGDQCIKRNPGAAIETTEITNSEGAKVAWSEVKNACESEGLTITDVCARYKLKYPAVYARATRGKWKVVSSISKRAKELQKREAELSTTAAQWARRGEAHRELAFNVAHRALAKANLKPPRTFKEAKIADEMARKACGLDQLDDRSQAVLIRINEMVDGHEERPIELNSIDTEPSRCNPASLSRESTLPALANES